MKTRKPTLEEKKLIAKQVTPIVNSIFNTFTKANLDDNVILNVCFAMINRIIIADLVPKKRMLEIIKSMYEDIKNIQ